MNTFFDGVSVIVGLELRQRVRSVAWSVLLFVFGGIMAIVTVLLTLALGGLGDSGTGKFLAAWITALAFLAVAVPFMAFSAFVGGLDPITIIVSVLVLAFELGLVAAIGVGLSGVIVRPLFSIVATYLVVAALSVGTLIAFTLGGLSVQNEVRTTTSVAASYDETGRGEDCITESVSTYNIPRFDYFWGILVVNPYVVLADAVPTEFSAEGYPEDLFGIVKVAARTAQVAPDLTVEYSQCDPIQTGPIGPTGEETVEDTVPGWFVGMLIQVAVAAAALAGAWASIRTPAKRLAKGSRIA